MAEWNPLVPELTVSDLVASRRFYEAAGATVRFERSDPPFVYLDLPGETIPAPQLMLEQDVHSGWLRGPLVHPFGRGVNFQLEVRQLDSLVSTMTAHGYPPFRAAQETWYATDEGFEEGQREALFADPDGYVWRFVQVLGRRPLSNST